MGMVKSALRMRLLREAPLDASAGESYAERVIGVAPGDALVMYTDGFIEAMDASGEQFGLERFEALVAGLGRGDVSENAASLRGAVRAFTGSGAQGDDESVVLVAFGDIGGRGRDQT